MKIAVATQNGSVSGHFGKCEQFTVFETEDKRIIGKVLLDTRAHGHGLLPAFLTSNGVETVIAGGMGDGAKQNLDSLGIRIVSGASGNVEEAVQQYLEGTLKVSEGGCHSGEHNSGHHCNCHGH
jgi:predicted Fe-Mo cluster-binding NifX family protein